MLNLLTCPSVIANEPMAQPTSPLEAWLAFASYGLVHGTANQVCLKLFARGNIQQMAEVFAIIRQAVNAIHFI